MINYHHAQTTKPRARQSKDGTWLVRFPGDAFSIGCLSGSLQSSLAEAHRRRIEREQIARKPAAA